MAEMNMKKKRVLEELAENIRRVESRLPGDGPENNVEEKAVPTGWGAGRDGPFPENALVRGAVHEWIGLAENAEAAIEPRGRNWTPPLCILSHLAWQALADGNEGPVLWIGRRCWPYPRTLIRRRGHHPLLLQRSVFVDARDDGQRLWAIDLAARCPAIAAVVADAARFDIAATRRLQLAARAGTGLVLLARPPWERNHLSAAKTRWLVRRGVCDRKPQWGVELLRCKGMRPMADAPPSWVVEWDGEKDAVVVSADVVRRSGAQTETRLAGLDVRKTA